jgi:hypothetical protein
MKRGIGLLLCLAVVFIDFTSRFLSIAVDAVFMIAAFYLLNESILSAPKSFSTKKDTDSGKSTSTDQDVS